MIDAIRQAALILMQTNQKHDSSLKGDQNLFWQKGQIYIAAQNTS